jgi:hypothetical protein
MSAYLKTVLSRLKNRLPQNGKPFGAGNLRHFDLP